ncbi:hypothetical protein AS29_004045 [Bacillus sp. SJS]|nr:hypothetical protein AS29_004045 [Bacillus sp. SJS]
MKKGSNQYFYHYNARGDVIALTDAQSNVVASYEYDAWGNVLNEVEQDSVKDNPYHYAGYQYDKETGMYYLIARYYEPKHGVFLASDPDPGDDDDILTQNGYAYAGNNPINMIDPDGNRYQPRPQDIVKAYVFVYVGGMWVRSQVKQGLRKYAGKIAKSFKPPTSKKNKGKGKGFKNYSAKEIEKKYGLRKGEFHQVKQDIIKDLTNKKSPYKASMKKVGSNPDIHLSSNGLIRVMSRNGKTSFDTNWNIKHFLP